MSGYPSLESLISRICSHVLPGPTEVSEEPRACSSFSCADLSFYTLWVSVAKNQIVLGVFLVQTPRILCCPCTPCPGVHVLCFTPAVLPLPGRGAASYAQTRVSVQLWLFSQQSPGVLQSHPCQLGSADAWRRAVLNECALGSFLLTSCLFISQPASTLNQDYFRILAKLASVETLTCVSAWRMSLRGLLWNLFCTSCVERAEDRS